MSQVLNKTISVRPVSNDTSGRNDGIRVLKKLCAYHRTELKLPPRDADDFTIEALRLSGFQEKEILLDKDWWKNENGAMLGRLNDGTPVALLPNKLFGYSLYHPNRRKAVRINAAIASSVAPEALAVFRMFPHQSINMKDISAFISKENIYMEIIVVLLCSFVASVLQVLPPILSAQIFDVIVPEKQQGILIETIFILLAFAVADIGFTTLSNLGIARVVTKVTMALQTAVWERLLSLKIPFFSSYATGELIQKAQGLEKIKTLVCAQNVRAVISNLFIFVNVIVLFNYFPVITIWVLLMMLGLVTVYAAVNMKKYRLNKKIMQINNLSSAFSRQSLCCIQRIKLSCAEHQIWTEWNALELKRNALVKSISVLDSIFDSLCIFFQFAAAAAVYFMISQTQDPAIGSFIAYIATFLAFQIRIVGLLKALQIMPELASICGNLKPILEACSEHDANKTIPKDMKGTIEVNHAVFRYDKYGRTILNDISFRVGEGESIGIIGMSGSGKSTLLKLLMGFYELMSGKIYYGGYDLETLDLRHLRRQIGVIMQNGSLIAGDIYSNITENDESIIYEDVMDALKKVEMDTVIQRLPNGVYTRLESNPLSDGEQQRLLIARAIVRRNKFIFMDEATSMLDNISQSRIMEKLRELPATKIIITQRMSAIDHCDKVIMIDNGKARVVR